MIFGEGGVRCEGFISSLKGNRRLVQDIECGEGVGLITGVGKDTNRMYITPGVLDSGEGSKLY